MSAAQRHRLDEEPPPFKKTAKQVEQSDLMISHEMVLAEGGARSGKTFNFLRQQIVRGMKTPSRHLAARSHLVQARQKLGLDTIPAVFALCFPGLEYDHNKSDNVFYFETYDGRQSELWLGGVEDHIERVLGAEYATIFLNECSLITFDTFETLTTRLAQSTDLDLRFYLDQNPTIRTSWTFRVFHEGITPDREKVEWDTAVIQMNPEDNAENLDPVYLKNLQRLPKRKKQRFWFGLYVDSIEGALWTDEMINFSKIRVPAEIVETIIAVDPSVGHREDSDECGIMVQSRDTERGGILHEDASGKLPVQEWAQRSVNLFHRYKANAIICEINQGGDLVPAIIQNIDPTVPVYTVHASKSKYARAEPIAQLYHEGQRKIFHDGDFPELEEELTTYVPRDAKYSPNRLDALVWGFTYLLGDGADVFDIAGG